jgi:very-long-chain enoyl-CoA reductase
MIVNIYMQFVQVYNAIQVVSNLSLLATCMFAPELAFVHWFIKVVECMQFCDVAFAVIGITRSSVVTTSLQTIAKTIVVINGQSDYIRYLGAIWALSDTVRYGYYLCPSSSLVKKIRYSQYKVLYPIGIGLEIVTIMPVITNEYLRIALSLVYVFGSPYMFNHTSILETQQQILSILNERIQDGGEYKISYGRATYSYDASQFGVIQQRLSSSRFNWKSTDEKSATLKDYGIQISWRLVYFIEYIGAFVAFPAIAGLGRVDTTLWIIHYAKRLLESLFLHSFSSDTMPLMNVFKNSAYYWGAGLLLGYYSQYATIVWSHDTMVVVMLWSMCQFGNGYCHWYLANLRSDKTSREHILPTNFLFRRVVCPNYTFEILGWALFALLGYNTSNSYFIVRTIFCCAGAGQMFTWAKGKKRRYKKLFGDKYKVDGNILPGL